MNVKDNFSKYLESILKFRSLYEMDKIQNDVFDELAL